MAEPKKPSATVKGISRREWCAQIGRLPKKVTAETRAMRAGYLKRAREVQVQRSGRLFGGKASWQKTLPPIHVPVEESPNKWAGLENHRESISD
jgi:hypothetical protein